MSPEGPFPGAGERSFGLIETFRWSRQDGYALLAEHLARLEHSAGALGFAFGRGHIERRLVGFASDLKGSPARVRLVLTRGGSVAITASPLDDAPATSYRVAVVEPRHHRDDVWLRHKTTLRDRYEGPLAAAAASSGADEVLFLNEQEELCEGARSNVFVRRGGFMLTPPLASGVLPGTLRAKLLQTGAAREAVLHLRDLETAPEWFMGNSVRGLVSSRLILR